MENTQKRSTTKEMNPNTKGVGAGHNRTHSTEGGGGYLNICNTMNIHDDDFRIQSLSGFGLSWKLITIAKTIGYENFVSLWKLLAVLYANDDSDSLRIIIAHPKRLLKIERNKMIITLYQDGYSVQDIVSQLNSKCGITITRRVVYRIISKHKEHSSIYEQ